MTAEPRFVVQPKHDRLRYGIWDNKLGKWVGATWWLQPAVAQSAADELNRKHT